MNSRLADDCRAKCSDCHGYGSHAGLELSDCLSCQTSEAPCPLHRCKSCAGSGLVCPACRGMRFVRDEPWDTRRSGGEVKVVRCKKCCEDNQVKPTIERRTIDRYMLRWRLQYADDTRETYQARQAAKQAEQDAANAEWRERSGATSGTLPKRERRKIAPLPPFRAWGES